MSSGSQPPKMPPMNNRDRDLVKREAEMLKILLNDPKGDINAAAEKAGFRPRSGYSVLTRYPVLNALVKDGQFHHLKWTHMLGKGKARLDEVLDMPLIGKEKKGEVGITPKDLCNFLKLLFETIIRSKAAPLAQTADESDRDPVDAVLGPMTTDEPQ